MLGTRISARIIGIGGCAALLVVCAAGRLLADDTPVEAIRLDYHAPGECPSRDVFSAQVFGRTPHARVAQDNERARAFAVRLTVTPERADGEVTIRDLDDSVSTRKVRGRTCDEVVLALALVTALAIDPTASMAPIPLAPAAASPPGDAAATVDAFVPTDTGALPPEVDAALALPPPNVEHETQPVAARLVQRPFAALSIALRTSLFPDVATQGAVALGFELDRGDILSPEVRGLFVAALTDDATTSLGRARYAYFGGRVDGCPIRLRPAASLDLRPCVALETGQFSARGLDIPDSQRSSRLWLELSALARVRYRPGIGGLFVELDAALELPLIRDRYIVDPPGTVIFRPPPFGGSGTLGLGWDL